MNAGESQTTVDHAAIIRWIERRSGHPAITQGTSGLRIDFPGYSQGDPLEHVSWDRFFEQFEGAKLALLYQDRARDGSISHFCQLIRRG